MNAIKKILFLVISLQLLAISLPAQLRIIGIYTTTATAAGTTTLTASSTHFQYFTGSTTQTVVLPVVSTLALGFAFEVDNLSTGDVTVQSSGANTIVVLSGGTSAIFTCIAITGTGTASWSYWYGGHSVTSGKKLTVSNSLTLAGTDGKGINIGAATSGKILQGDGSNLVLSTPTYPTTAGTSGKVLISDGTNIVSSTPTFPNASATSGKVIKSDGTNWTASTETYAAPSTAGNQLVSDGTNWTALNTRENWTTFVVSGSNATTTGQALVDVTGLTSGTLSNSTLYEVEAWLNVTTSAVTTGCQYAITAGGSGGAAVVQAMLIGNSTGTTITTENIVASATATSARLLTSGQSGMMYIHGWVTTRGAGTANISIQHLKVTSGTSTVLIGSKLKIRLAN